MLEFIAPVTQEYYYSALPDDYAAPFRSSLTIDDGPLT